MGFEVLSINLLRGESGYQIRNLHSSAARNSTKHPMTKHHPTSETTQQSIQATSRPQLQNENEPGCIHNLAIGVSCQLQMIATRASPRIFPEMSSILAALNQIRRSKLYRLVINPSDDTPTC